MGLAVRKTRMKPEEGEMLTAVKPPPSQTVIKLSS